MRKVHINFADRDFYFRGKSDKGVMSHFWNNLFNITTTKDKPLNIIDAGAHIGDETLRFRYFHPDANIVAIEAEKNNFEVLSKNFSEDKNVKLFNKALWNEKTTLNIAQHSDSTEAFRVREKDSSNTSSTEIKTITIPIIMQENNWDEIDILKLDIEGAEKTIFTKNFDEWIEKVNVFVFEIPDSDIPGTTQLIFDAISKHGIIVTCHNVDEYLVLIKENQPFGLERIKYY